MPAGIGATTVRGQPTLATETDDVRAQHQILDHEVFIALEARAGGDVGRNDLLLADGEPLGLAAPGPTAPVPPVRLGLGALLHAAGLELGPALDAFERRDLRPQFGDRLLQRRVLRQQPLGQRLKLAAWQARKGDLRRG
jgi:hypothetical protein